MRVSLMLSRESQCTCLCNDCPFYVTANWAQVSGNIDQNVVVPYFPGPNQPHWQARYGMATVVAVSCR